MKKFGFAPSAISLVCVLVVAIGALSASARPQYNTQFKGKYIEPDSKDPNKKKLADAFATAKCGVCHEGTKDKKVRNAYGKDLEKILAKNEKAKDKIDKALDEIADKKANEKDPNSKTFGERMKEGLLPVDVK
jgi:hypothetical protein